MDIGKTVKTVTIEKIPDGCPPVIEEPAPVSVPERELEPVP